MTDYLTAQGVQHFSITIASGSTTGTATITAVGTGAFILWNGINPSISNNPAEDFARLTLTNSTTITATRNTGTAGTVVVKGCIVDGDTTNFITSIQYGTVSIAAATSGTASISAVTNVNTAVHLLGWSSTNTTLSGINEYPVLALSGTTVTATRPGTTGTLTVGFVVIEFQGSSLNQNVQNVVATSSANVTSYTASINSVVMNNAMTIYAGSRVSTATTNPQSFKQYGELTSSTVFTITRATTGTQAKQYNCSVIEFVTGVLNSSVQRNTTTLTGVTSNTTNISSITEANTALSYLGSITSATTAVLDGVEGTAVLGSVSLSTTVIQSTASTGTGPFTVTLDQNTVAGSLLVVCVALINTTTNSATVSSVTDSAGQTYTNVTAANGSSSAGNGSQSSIWYFQNSVSGVSTVTVNMSNPTNGYFSIYEVSNIITSGNPVDATAVLNNQTASSTAVSGSITTTVANDFIAVCLGGNTGAIYSSVAAPYTNLVSGISSAYHIPNSTVTSETATFTQSSSKAYSVSSTAFKSTGTVVIQDIVTVAKATATANITSSWEVVEFAPFSNPIPTGTLSVTEASDTMSSSGVEFFIGSMSTTESKDVFVGTGIETFISILSATESSDTLVASGVESFLGLFASTEARDTQVAASTLSFIATMASMEGSDGFAASGSQVIVISGSLSSTEANDALVGGGGETFLGSMSSIEAPDTLTASSITGFIGLLLAVESTDSFTGVGFEPYMTGTVTAMESSDNFNGVGTAINIGSGGFVESPDIMLADASRDVSNEIAVIDLITQAAPLCEGPEKELVTRGKDNT